MFSAPSDGLSATEYAAKLPADAYRAQAQWLLLKEFLDNGQARLLDEGIHISSEEICNLDSVDQELLGVPEPYPFDVEIRSFGTLNQPDFRYLYRYLQPDMKPLHPQRIGCVIRLTREWAYLLTGEQFALLEELDSFNTRDETGKDYKTNLLEFARIKGLANQTGVLLDRYLNHEDVVAPQTIRLRLRESEDSVEIIPDVAGVDSDQFEEAFDKYPNPETTYNLPKPDGGRTRVVFNDEHREALQSVRSYRHVSREELAEIAEHPQAHFDPDVFELDPTDETLSFSERVRQIGIYRPRIYPFISPYKSKWIPGILVADESGTRSKIRITTNEDLASLKHAIREAKKTGRKQLEWNGEDLPVSEIEQYVPFIEKQLKHGKKTSRTNRQPSETSVLIIDENIEESGYVEGKPDSPIGEEFRHLLESFPNLKEGVRLLPHQEEGLAWAQQLCQRKFPGGLLADDMGLGKTLQVLCFLEWHYSRYNTQLPYLIVAPIALLENWQAEYPKFFDRGELDFITLYGAELHNFKHQLSDGGDITIPKITGADRLREIRQRRGALDVKRLQAARLVLTTYETVRDFQLDLGLIPWSVVVIDEAQNIKTPGTLVTNALKALKTDFRLALTGTPVENSLMDLWCITDFVAPGNLGSAKDFDKEFCRPLKRTETDVRTLGEQIRKQIGVHFKRRIKSDILNDLPEKHIHVKDCQRDMPPEQVERYLAALQSVHECESSGQQSRNRVLQVIHRLRDISDHPLLANSQWERLSTSVLIKQSAKLQVATGLLGGIRSADEKVILFAERRKTQHLLARVIREHFGLESVVIVNGETPGSKQRANSMKLSRQQNIDQFQSTRGFNAIIMSPLVAGFGLNITQANHVIHYSRWWNPAKEDQASDRVHRIGQTRPVHVYLPMATHPEFETFDVILNELLERKRQLSHGTLFPTEQAEVTPSEILGKLRPVRVEGGNDTPLTIDDVDSLEPLSFEAFVADVFQKQGYCVELTPFHGDKGADVVVHQRRGERGGLLVQVKHRRDPGKSGSDAVREIVAAKPFYEDKYGVRFMPAVVTNQEFTKEAQELSRVNRVKLHERKWLNKTLEKHPVTWTDVNRMLL